MRLLRNYRLPLLAFAVAAGAGSSLTRPSLQAHDEAELRSALSNALGQHVDRVVWEPSRGVVADTLFGRRALLLASDGPNTPRDVLRARVRVSYEGVPLELCDAVNLTNTPLADEHDLTIAGHYALFSSFSFDAEQAVSVLDLDGEGAQNLTEGTDRILAALTNVQNTGSFEGLGRVDVAFEEPVHALQMSMQNTRLSLDLEKAGGREHLELDVTQPDLTPPGLRAEAARHLPKRLVFWAVDTVRAVPWIGPAPIAWLEERVFALRDQARQIAHSGDGETVTNLATLEAAELPPAKFDETQPLWPPADIPSPWSTPEPDEGKWKPPTQPWLDRLPSVEGEEAPLPFLTTFVRPDEQRSYSRVLLVAMDMRQLQLGMEAGVEDPKPLSGPPGTGRLPRKPEIYKRAVAAFNGGFKTEHGAYGMMVDKRVLLPALPGGATIGTLSDGKVVLGTWGKDPREGGPPPPAELVSFRQNMDPLVEDGVVNPTKRYQWGFVRKDLPGNGMQTERSGVCMTAQGQLLYAWGDDVSADTLGKAMRLAQCNYGIHLDMNPHHTGFMFMHIDELKGRKYKSELVSKKMEISPDRYIEYAPKDFFYLLLRDPSPPALALSEDTEAVAWTPMSVLPPPKFLPALHTARIGEVELLSVAPGRIDFRLRAGSGESENKQARELSSEDAARALLAVGLGKSARRGLYVGGQSLGETIGGSGRAWLVIGADGAPRIADAAPEKDAECIELSKLGEGGKATLALAKLADGRLVIARAPAPSAEVGRLLTIAGAREVYAIDGGSGALYQANTERALRAHYDEPTLSLLAAPMTPKVTRFTPSEPYVAPPPPKRK